MIGSDEGINLVCTNGKLIWTIHGNVDGITLEFDVGTEMGSLYWSCNFSNVGKLEGLLLVGSLVSTDGKVIGSDEGIELILYDGKVIGTILGNVDVISLYIDVVTELGSLDV